MRPIVSAFNRPAANLGRFMARFLRGIFKSAHNYTINNSVDLIEIVGKTNFNSKHIIVSSDVVTLYASVRDNPSIPNEHRI